MKILKLILQSRDLEEVIKFYQKTLGFELLSRTENSVSFQVGFSELIFEKDSNGTSHLYHFAFLISKNSIEQAYSWLKDRVQILNSEDGPIVTFEKWKARSVYFEDNQGNILEFIERSELQNELKEDFSIQSISCINEIGIVGNCPIEISEKIKLHSGLEDFKRGPNKPEFKAIGNDSGLLIISKIGRKWYPTQAQARPYPIRFEIMVENNSISNRHIFDTSDLLV